MSIYAHYDPGADIVLLRLEDTKGAHVVSEETEFGLRDVDDRDGRVLGLELWDASTRLPADLLAMIGPTGSAAA